jgi:hypothetical protein
METFGRYDALGRCRFFDASCAGVAVAWSRLSYRSARISVSGSAESVSLCALAQVVSVYLVPTPSFWFPHRNSNISL